MVRDFQLEDAEDVYLLGELLVADFHKLYDLEKIFKDEYSYIYVYIDEGIKGFIQVTKLYENMDIVNIVVKENYRRMGIATKLFQYAISKFTDLKEVTLEVAVDNLPAISFYEKMGFKMLSIRKNYYKTSDAYLMKKEV